MTKRDIEEREQEILREAKDDDQSELGEKDSLLFTIREKDKQITDLKVANSELSKFVNSHDIRNHPDYKQLQETFERIRADRDNLLLENEELKEATRKLTENSFQPAAKVKPGGLGP